MFDPDRLGLLALASSFAQEHEQCSILQAFQGENCGCSNPIARSKLKCPLCVHYVVLVNHFRNQPERLMANDTNLMASTREYCCMPAGRLA